MDLILFWYYRKNVNPSKIFYVEPIFVFSEVRDWGV